MFQLNLHPGAPKAVSFKGITVVKGRRAHPNASVRGYKNTSGEIVEIKTARFDFKSEENDDQVKKIS